MLHVSPFKAISVAILCVLALVFAIPNLFEKQTVAGWPDWLPKKQLSLGLDLRGGAHLLLRMDTKEVRDGMLTSLRADVRAAMRRARIGVRATGIRDNAVQLRLAPNADREKALTELRRIIEPLAISNILGRNVQNVTLTEQSDGRVDLTLTDDAIRQRIADAIGASIETLRRRIDPAGNKDATITRSGLERILVQVPGIKTQAELDAIKRIIGKTAALSFHAVHPNETYSGGAVPPGYRTYLSAEQAGLQYLLQANPVVKGDDLVDAQPGFDQRTNEPIITFRFNQNGARRFGRWTAANVTRPFAIVLDGQVLSAPVVREPILGGSGQISGSFTPQSAQELAISLKSGALPAKLTIVEERTVGPTLGADSIASGMSAFVIGAIATLLVTILVYGTFGIIAVVGLLINAILIVAVMTLLGSTLTLPGIAGLVLTIGMAIDANVLIYERIREELRNGRSAVSAIDIGFGRAMVTILDSQITTLAAAIIMFWLGSGPIRGFAVTLSIGIFTSVFTAVVFVRMLVALWFRSERAKTRNVDVPI
ncbi:MAG: protein translocase subunit SecD [Pseudomonadota bacterium]